MRYLGGPLPTGPALAILVLAFAACDTGTDPDPYDGPAFSPGPAPTVAEDAPAQTLPGWATGISVGPEGDPPLAGAGFTLTAGDPSLFSVQPALTLEGTLSFTPAPDAFGSTTVTATLSDGRGGGASQVFTVTVTPENDPPTFTVGADVTVPEDAGAQTRAGWATAISAGPGESFGAGAGFTVTTDDGELFGVEPAVTLDGTLTFTPASGATGSAEVSVELADGEGASSSAGVFTITIAPVNDAPSFTKGPDQAVDEDSGPHTRAGWASAISPGPPDESGQTVTFVVTTDAGALFSQQPAVSPAGDLTFTPAPNAFGTATVTVRARDDGGTANGGVDTSPAQVFTIVVRAVNDPPSFTGGPNVKVGSGAVARTVEDWATVVSPGPGETFGEGAAFVVTNADNSFFRLQPRLSLDGTLTFTPSSTATTAVEVYAVLTDGDGGSSTPDTFRISINKAPVATPQSVSTNEDTPVIIVLSGTDADGDSLTFAIVSPPGAGTLSAITKLTATTARVTYSPVVGQIGDQSFTFRVSDGTDTSATATVTLTVIDVPGVTSGRAGGGTSPPGGPPPER